MESGPGYLWCATEDGRRGRVPKDHLGVDGRHAVALRDYDSSRLTVVTGEELDVPEQADDHLLRHSAARVDGWVPASCVEELEEER
jgi:hypothetical protein